jgi:hypothetical protein
VAAEVAVNQTLASKGIIAERVRGKVQGQGIYTDLVMIPVGYMAKQVSDKPGFLKASTDFEVYSVSSCINDYFADYINFWKHNGYWLFDSPEIIRAVAKENSIDLNGTQLFYYEAHEMEFDGRGWKTFAPEPSTPTNVTPPQRKRLEGFDVVTFFAGNAPECSPLSCNGLAEKIPTNQHCLLESFEFAESCLNSGKFEGTEPGPYRIFAVYSVDWP